MVFISPSNISPKFTDNIISIGVSLESQLISLINFIKKEKRNKTVIMFPENQYTSLVEQKLKEMNLTNIRTFKYNPNPQVLTGEIETLTNYSQRKNNLKLRKKMFEDKDDEQSTKALERLEQLYTLGDVNFDSVIIIDFGTATTFDVIDSKGNYDGGIITPGIDLSLKVLSEKTAKLPLVKFAKTKNVIGRDTKSAIESGFFWGYVSMIQGLVKKISREKRNSFSIILTGGNCNIFKRLIENVIVSDDLFNSKGLNFIINEYLKNEY